MKFSSVENTLFLRDLVESSAFDDLFGSNYLEVAPPLEPAKPNRYSPKFTRGLGAEREGYCELCDKWFKLKTSSYWYHMNYKHGINSKGLRYPEPIFRDTHHKTEGYCRECCEWIYLGSKKKNTRFAWLRHWQKAHSKRTSTS